MVQQPSALPYEEQARVRALESVRTEQLGPRLVPPLPPARQASAVEERPLPPLPLSFRLSVWRGHR